MKYLFISMLLLFFCATPVFADHHYTDVYRVVCYSPNAWTSVVFNKNLIIIEANKNRIKGLDPRTKKLVIILNATCKLEEK